MIYALLVGINAYKSENVSNLNGCKDDVANMLAFLESRYAGNLTAKTLLDFQAKKEKVIFNLGTGLFLNDDGEFVPPKKEDTVLFYFSGHGSQEPAPEEFGGGKNETFLCQDSRTDGVPDLADKEIAALMAKVAVNDPHLVLIFDSCHSGSITRDGDDFRLGKTRFATASKEPRELNSYLPGFYAEEGEQKAESYYERMLREKRKIEIPASTHILMSACDKAEKAYELEEGKGGVFTTTLLKVLKEGTHISYANLFTQARASIRHWAHNQSPQFETHEGFNAYYSFLSSEINDAPIPIPVHREESEMMQQKPYWVMERGAIHGISTDVASEVMVDIYQGEKQVAKAKAEAVRPKNSKLIITEGKLDKTVSSYTAKITSMPADPLLLAFTGPATDQYSILQEALKGEFPLIFGATKPEFTIHIEETDTEEHIFTFSMVHEASQTRIGAVRGPIESMDDIASYLYNQLISAVHRWKIFRKLQNSQPQLDPDEVSFELITYDDKTNKSNPQAYEGSFDLACDKEGEGTKARWKSKHFRMRVTNRTSQELYASLFYISPWYGISPQAGEQTLIEAGTSEFLKLIPLKSSKGVVRTEKQRLWSRESIPKKVVGSEVDSIYKVIFSTERIDDFLMKQKELDFEKVHVITRGSKAPEEEDEDIPKLVRNDWFTKELDIRLVRNEHKLDPSKNETIELAKGRISIESHAGLKAKLAIHSAETNSRSAPVSVIPSMLKERGINVLSFGDRNTEADNVLELSNIEDVSSVKAEQPLKLNLNLPTDLEEGEVVIPFTFDGEHILPIGEMVSKEGKKASIHIDQIPDEIKRTRSAGKAMKMVFGRLIFGESDSHYQLRWVDYAEESADKQRKLEGIEGKVKQANKILVCIHGIIGETNSIYPAVESATQSTANPKGYDLVLTYDYENLKGPIEDIAQKLGERLEAAGIDASVKKPGTQKTVDILAHSMGGLVSRWYIEQLEGNKVINRLILAGTPNGGSPFGKLSEMPKIALTMSLNIPFHKTISKVASAIFSGLSKTKHISQTLRQMDKDSPFLQDLNVTKSKDPEIPYTILAGSLDLYEKMLTKQGEESKSVIKLMDKILIDAGEMFKVDNDLAVPVDSIRHIPAGRKIPPKEPRPELACNHLNYFEMIDTNPAWEVLKEVLAE